MKIVKKEKVLHVHKPEGLDVHYYLFDEYEIHHDIQEPHTSQIWHHHEKVWETIYIIEGELTARWKENGDMKEQTVKAGDVVESEYSPHTYINASDKIVKFLVFKQILNGKNKKDLLKTDKVLD